MKPLHLWAATFLLLLAVSPALADVAPPDHKKAPKPGDIRTDLPFMHMTILPVEGLREARLQVPRDLLSKLPAAPAGVAGSVDGARRTPARCSSSSRMAWCAEAKSASRSSRKATASRCSSPRKSGRATKRNNGCNARLTSARVARAARP